MVNGFGAEEYFSRHGFWKAWGHHHLAAKKVSAAAVIDGANEFSFGSNYGVHANLLGWDSPHVIVPHKRRAPLEGFIGTKLDGGFLKKNGHGANITRRPLRT
jgi:hypothetical protein